LILAIMLKVLRQQLTSTTASLLQARSLTRRKYATAVTLLEREDEQEPVSHEDESQAISLSRDLDNRQADHALHIFRGLLQQAESPALLERSIQDFARHRRYLQMSKALSAYLDHGYVPSTQLWTRILQVAGLAETPPTDIRPYFQQGLSAAINDEDSLLALIKYTSKYGLIEYGEELFTRYEKVLHESEEDKTAHPPPRFWAALIDGRAKIGDLDGACNWFIRWRTSPAHPLTLGSDDTLSATLHKQSSALSLEHLSSGNRRTGYDLALRSAFITHSSSAYRLSNVRSAHTLPDLPALVQPDPAPYLSLLKHLTWPGSPHSLHLLELMAADCVPLKTRTMNAIMQHEYARQEKGSLASILALYHKMRSDPDSSHQPDHSTFYTVFRAYSLPRRWSTIGNFSHLPTRLARQAELPLPPADLTDHPRGVFYDLLATHAKYRRDYDVPDFVKGELLEEAIGAFARTRDWVGCSAALRFFGILCIEPTARLHAVISLHILRARERGEAFYGGGGEAMSMSDEEATRLQNHIQHLNDLAGYESPIVVRVQRLEHAQSDGERISAYTISNNLDQTQSSQDEFAIATWNDRPVPRTEKELRKTRRFEYRHFEPLRDLLRRASGKQEDEWNAEVGKLLNHFRAAMRSPEATTRGRQQNGRRHVNIRS
jgi:hypothetical protein